MKIIHVYMLQFVIIEDHNVSVVLMSFFNICVHFLFTCNDPVESVADRFFRNQEAISA